MGFPARHLIKVQNTLDTFGIPYQKHPPLYGQPDLVLPDNIAIFCDGCYWHNCPTHFSDNPVIRAIKRDKEVNEHLTNEGWKVIRLWEHEINKMSEQDILEKIKRKRVRSSFLLRSV